MFFERISSRSKYVVGAAGAVCFLAATLMAGEAAARSAALEKVIAGAKKEGVLRVLWTEGHFGGDVGFRAMLAAINKRYGTNIQLQFTQGGSFPVNLGRLTQEYRAGQPSSSDIFLGGANHMVAGLKSGMLMKVDWEALVERPKPPHPVLDRLDRAGAGDVRDQPASLHRQVVHAVLIHDHICFLVIYYYRLAILI